MKWAILRRRSDNTTNFLRTHNPSSTSLLTPSIPRILSRSPMVTTRREISRRGPSASRTVASMTRKKIPEMKTRRIFEMIKKSKRMKKTVLMKMAKGTIIKRTLKLKSLSMSRNLLVRSAKSSHLPLDKSRRRKKRKKKSSALVMNLLTISICLVRTCLQKMMSV